MKINFKFTSAMLAVALMCCASCDSKNNSNNEPPEDPASKYHFDIWVAADRHGGMGRDVTTLVGSFSSLDADQPMITFEGFGAEINSVLSLETIYKGAYYYQVPVSSDRFSKFIIRDNKIVTIAERRFGENTYATRKYSHAWLSDNTLLIMAANGDANKIIWTKLNTDNMKIIAEGTLNLPLPEGAAKFSTSGITVYRASDNKIFHFYLPKTAGSGMSSKAIGPFWVAVINPDDMNVVSNEENSCGVGETIGSAYGELLQRIAFVDEAGTLYLGGFSEDETGEHSYLLRIKNGMNNFDTSYNGFRAKGKLLSMLYLGQGKAITYARNDELGTGIDSFCHYYSITNLATSSSERISYNGEELGYSSGRFSCRMDARDGKAYFGIDEENSNPKIFIYDINTGKTTKGVEMKPGYYFEQIRILDNYEE